MPLIGCAGLRRSEFRPQAFQFPLAPGEHLARRHVLADLVVVVRVDGFPGVVEQVQPGADRRQRGLGRGAQREEIDRVLQGRGTLPDLAAALLPESDAGGRLQ